jgi:hypothetical protein
MWAPSADRPRPPLRKVRLARVARTFGREQRQAPYAMRHAAEGLPLAAARPRMTVLGAEDAAASARRRWRLRPARRSVVERQRNPSRCPLTNRPEDGNTLLTAQGRGREGRQSATADTGTLFGPPTLGQSDPGRTVRLRYDTAGHDPADRSRPDGLGRATAQRCGTYCISIRPLNLRLRTDDTLPGRRDRCPRPGLRALAGRW